MISINNDVNIESVEKYGVTKQSIVAMEECAELIQSISKVLRYGFNYNADIHDNLIEEMADVYIILDQLKVMHEIKDTEINDWIIKKQIREKKRLENIKQD